MFEVTIEHPGIEDRTYFADRQGELRNIVWGVARAQGKPTTNDREMIAIVGGIASDWAIRGEATLKVHDVTVIVRDPAGCDGHAGEDGVLLGGPETCDGSCKPRPRFSLAAAADLTCALDDAELDATGGCGPCGLEAGQMCAGCGKCNCHTHETCVRPAGERA
ncbi:hypothetical protein HEP81_04617 [Streptomyces griseofuscus]|uniref:Uncharacterized protein n=1 Tax=Streptomyces griseofuscus TaxID=146922 RepID=A0A7H1Q3L0_9ACTN|nr:hypothetical protein [Streptomyces griseofuscus]QNT94890.1 hypothetical protein HEP81_04617 [Streptomyces griseofuscus]